MIRLSNNNNASTNDKISFETDGWGTNSSKVKSSISILSSRPAMGKTSFAIQLACTVNPEVPFLYISNETITNKTIAHLTGISLDKINSNNLSIEEIVAVTKANQKLKSMAFNILENVQFTTKDSLQTIRQAIISKQPKGVIIDGINWRDFKNNQCTQNDYIQYFNELKSIAEEYNIDFLVLHELDRTVEKKDNNSVPDLTDLKNESFLTTITENIFFLYRPMYYGITDYYPQFKEKQMIEVICFEKGKKESNLFEINTGFNQFISLDPDSISTM